MALIGEFAVWWAAVFTSSAAIFFVVCLTILAVNRRHPERKIQTRSPSREARRDIVASLGQIGVTSICLALGLFSQHRGWTPAPVETSWWSVPIFVLISMVLHDAWFYFTHRLLHTKRFYRFHKPHHLNVTPTVWSNDAGSTVDTIFAHSYYALILFVLPMPALSFVIHRIIDQVSAIIGHSGYEYFASRTARAPWPLLCTTYHDQHHSEFVYNYANYFSFWDRALGTIHPHYDRIVEGWEKTGARPAMPKATDRVDA